MMRLQRVGRKNDPSYRVVVTDKRTGPKSNKNIDVLGSYNPKMNQLAIDGKKAQEWLSKGVQPSDTVHNLLVSQKLIEGKKINVLPKKQPIIDEEAKAAAEAAAAVPAKSQEETSAEVPAEAAAEEAPVSEEGEKSEAPAEEVKKEEDAPEAQDQEKEKASA